MGDEKARIGFPRAFSSPIPVLFPFHPIHSLPSPSIRSRGLRPLASSILADSHTIRPLRPRVPTKAPVTGIFFFTCIHLVGGTSDVRMAVASEWLAGPGPARSFFPQPGLGASGGACAAARILVLRPPRPSHMSSCTNPKRLASRGPVSVCVCVCVCVCECACVRVCAPAFALACLLTQTRAHAHSSVCLWPQ